MSLIDCLGKSKYFKPTEITALAKKSEAYQKQGMSKIEADKKVISEEIKSVHDNMRSVYNQLGVEFPGMENPTTDHNQQEEVKTPTQNVQNPVQDSVQQSVSEEGSVGRNSQQHTAGYSAIALDYLFTGGRDALLSTDYLLQALVGGFEFAAKEIDIIRNKYADKIGNIKDDINSDVYKALMQEIREVINKKYNNTNASEIFDKILNNSTGFTVREGNVVSIELEKLNEQSLKEQPEQNIQENVQTEGVNEGVTRPEVEATPKNRTLLDRAANSKAPEQVKAAIRAFGLEREVVSNEEAEKAAQGFIDYAGVDAALDAVRDGSIRGSHASYVWAKAIDAVGAEFEGASPELQDQLAGLQASLLNEFDLMIGDAARELQALSNIYKVSPLGYAKYIDKKVDRTNAANMTRFKSQIDELKAKVDQLMKENADQLTSLKDLEDRLNSKSDNKVKRKQELADKFKNRFRAMNLLAGSLFLQSQDPGNPVQTYPSQYFDIKSTDTLQDVFKKLSQHDSDLKPILDHLMKQNHGDLGFILYTPGENELIDDFINGQKVNNPNYDISGLYFDSNFGFSTPLSRLANKIVINTEKSTNFYYDFIHEAMHWHTLENIGQLQNFIGEKAQKNLEALYKYIDAFKGVANTRYDAATYGMQNYKEFLAEICINPYFRKHLSDLVIRNKEEFEQVTGIKLNPKMDFIAEFSAKFIKFIKKLFGINDNPNVDTKDSVLDNAIRLMEQVYFGGQNVTSKITASGEFAPLPDVNIEGAYAMASNGLIEDKEFMEYARLVAEDKTFEGFSEEMIENVGEGVRPFLQEVYKVAFSRTPDSIRKQIEKGRKKLMDAALKDLDAVRQELWDQYENTVINSVVSKAAKDLGGVVTAPPALLDNFARGMIKNFMGMVKSEPVAQTKRSTPIEILSDMFHNKEKYEDVLRGAYEKLKSQYEKSNKPFPEMLKMYEYFKDNFRTLMSDNLIDQSIGDQMKVDEGKENVGKKMIQLAREYYLGGEAHAITLAQKLSQSAGIDEYDAQIFAAEIERVFDEKLNQKVLTEIDKTFKTKTTEKNREKKNKIVEAINLGLKTNVRKDGTPFDFQQEFFDMLGFVNPRDPDVRKKLNDFAERIYKNRDARNPIFQHMVEIELEDYLANKSNENRLVAGLTSQMYANMLYGQDTHIRNTVFNIQKAVLSTMIMVARNPKQAGNLLKAFGVNFDRGVREAVSIIKTGNPKSGTIEGRPNARAFVERAVDLGFWSSIWSRYARTPGRFLSALDAALSMPLRGSRAALLVTEVYKKEHPSESREEVAKAVDLLLFGNQDNQQEWRDYAEKQVQQFYKIDKPLFIDGERNPEFKSRKYNNMYRDYKRSFYNLREQNLSKEINDEAKQFADAELLMGTPRGTFGAVAKVIGSLGDFLPLLKVTNFPFINVPFNMAAHFYEMTPFGYINVLANREGLGITVDALKKHKIEYELSEQRRKDLAWKASLGTIGMAAAYALTKATYYDDDEKKERPLLIVTADGTGNWQDNQKLQGLTGSDKFEEYTVDFMGSRFSYKSSPFAAWFLPSGYLMDYERYGKKDNVVQALEMKEQGLSEADIRSNFIDKEGIEARKVQAIIDEANDANWLDDPRTTRFKKAVGGYLSFMKDQSSISGFADFVGLSSASKDDKGKSDWVRRTKKSGANIIRSLVLPNFIPQSYRHYKSITDGLDSRAVDFDDYLMKDIPFVDDYVSKSYDHFGNPIKSKAKIPGFWNERGQDRPEYELMKDKEYLSNIKRFYQSKITLDRKDVYLNADQIQQIDFERAKWIGEFVRTHMDDLKRLDNQEFRKRMNNVQNVRALDAALEKVGIK